MIDVYLAICTLYLLLILIGLGPSLLLMGTHFTFITKLFLSPLLGLIVITCVGSYLILLSYPIAAWASPFLSFSIVISFFLSLLATWIHGRTYILELKLIKYHFLGIFLVFFCVLLPLMIQGLDFSIMRGNRIDSFNYMTMAGYLITQPWDWLYQASTQSLIDLHPAYYMTKDLLLKSRWATSMLLGWCSVITHVPLYRIEFAFTALFFILLFSPVFLLVLELKLKLKYALLVSLAICIGFWGQIVLDIRAMSHISILPILLLFSLTLGTLIDDKKRIELTKLIFLGLLLGTLMILYIEIIPSILLATFVFLIFNIISNKQSFRSSLLPIGLVIAVTTLVILPHFSHTLQFVSEQITSVFKGAHGSNNWDSSYFPWLYNLPLIGFWGLSLLSTEHNIVLYLYSFVLTLIFVYSFVYFRKSTPITNSSLLIQILTVIFLFEFVFLFLQGKNWAAGKALSYGYPFIMLNLALWLSLNNLKKLISVKYVILSFFILQCLLGFYRIYNSIEAQDYSNYISWGDYHQHDLNFDAISQAIVKNRCTAVGISVKNHAIAEYLEIIYGWNLPAIELNGVRTGDNKLIGLQKTLSLHCIITDKKNDNFKKAVASNREYVLLHHR